jgi:hypothetical protein
MDKEKKKEIIFKMFNMFYNNLTSNDNNLDKKNYFSDETGHRLVLVPYQLSDDNKKYYLGYYKKDFKKLNSLNPKLTKWFFEKYLVEWFEQTYGYKPDGVLLPLK